MRRARIGTIVALKSNPNKPIGTLCAYLKDGVVRIILYTEPSRFTIIKQTELTPVVDEELVKL